MPTSSQKEISAGTTLFLVLAFLALFILVGYVLIESADAENLVILGAAAGALATIIAVIKGIVRAVRGY